MKTFFNGPNFTWLLLLIFSSCDHHFEEAESFSHKFNPSDTATLFSYFPSGSLARKFTILPDSTLHGPFQNFYSSGGIKVETNYNLGVKEGYRKLYYPNGALASIHEYHAGRLNGTFRYFNENGGLYQKGTYNNDKLVGKMESYYENGNLLSEFYY